MSRRNGSKQKSFRFTCSEIVKQNGNTIFSFFRHGSSHSSLPPGVCLIVFFQIKQATMSLKEQHERSSEENSRLQQQIKEANEEYRRRLWKYVQDIAVSCDTCWNLNLLWGAILVEDSQSRQPALNFGLCSAVKIFHWDKRFIVFFGSFDRN